VAIAEVGAKSGQLNLVIEQGATFDTTVTWTADGTPVDLTGYTARMKVAEDYDSTPALSLTSSPAAGLTLGGTAGTIRIVITDEQTATLAIESGKYDLELEAADGTVRRLLRGNVSVLQEVTA
jgi:hypothetical protein